MLSSKEESVIATLGESIREIYFCKIPEPSILEALLEHSDKIRYHFPLEKACGFIGEYSDYGWSANISSANFETDILIDSEELYSYPNLINLVLTCSNSEVNSIDDRDLMDMQLAIYNLTKLKSVTFNLNKMQSNPIDQIKESIIFPGRDISIEFTSSNGKKRKHHTKIAIK